MIQEPDEYHDFEHTLSKIESNMIMTSKYSQNLEDQIRELEDDLKNSDDIDTENDSHESRIDVVCLSKCLSIKNKIPKLPHYSLPTCTSKRMGVDKVYQKETNTSNMNDRLSKQIFENLSKYHPSHHIPYYCRVCFQTSKNKIQFKHHLSTEEHILATKLEKKASYCKVCSCQCTSVIQLKEHLLSKPHRERMERLICKKKLCYKRVFRPKKIDKCRGN